MCGWYQYNPGGSSTGMRKRYSKGGSPGSIDVRTTSSWWQTGGIVSPWKWRFVEVAFIKPAVHPLDVFAAALCWWEEDFALRRSVKSFFSVRMTRSPGFTRKLGD